MAAAKKAPGKNAPAQKASPKKAPATHVGVRPAAKKSPASRVSAKAAPAKRSSAKQAATTAPLAKKAPAEDVPSGTATKDPGKRSPLPKSATTKSTSRSTSTFGMSANSFLLPEPRGVSKDGIAYTKDFDVKFLKAQRDLLEDEKAKLMGQATRLENEANSLIEEAEMGDVQFDDEGGEGDTMVVERERDLALSAQARQTIADIDHALERLAKGTYGYSSASGRPIPRERLEAIPWATELVEEKVGGIGRR
jgi:RNA polymerase-binding transcription factor DksA